MTILRRGALAAVAALFMPGTPVAAQGTRPEWKLVPAMPASCFSDDRFDGQVGEAQNAAIAAKGQQDAVNAKIREQFDAMPMMEKAQRMQAWMMKNPQAASKMLEASSNSDAVAAMSDAVKASQERLAKELEAHKTAFNAAADRAVQPVDARIDALIKTKAQKTHVAAVFTTDADYSAYVALVNERNAAYEKACAPFFGAGGAFHRWLAAYRSEVTEKQLAAGEAGDAVMAQQFAIMDTPSGGYRSTGGYDVVREHLRRLQEVVGYRRWKAVPDPVLRPTR